MGCGGSRADAIEPRYYESWTRETESTWLTNTDAEPPQQTLPSAAGPESADAEASLKKSPGCSSLDTFQFINILPKIWCTEVDTIL